MRIYRYSSVDFPVLLLITNLKDVEFYFNKTLHLYSGPLK